jgi:nicotinate-nucleotide--dimethylbenzimidazole phosphoribosyltransferase
MSTVWNIKPVSQQHSDAIQHKINMKTKPLGALGLLEKTAHQLAMIQGTTEISINKPTMLVFAGDHGVAEEKVSLTSSDVTRQMVLNFLTGGAAINCFCHANNMDLKVIDAGIKTPIEDDRLIIQRIGAGTRNLAKESAMTQEEVVQALEYGRQLAKKMARQGCNLLAFGEMGIGNTTPAACIMAVLMNKSAAECVGRGTGISDAQLKHKIVVTETAVARIGNKKDALNILQEVGGFEIAQICGAMLGAAEAGIAMLVDGFIITSAALLATQCAPACRDYMLFAHCSGEQGHQAMLEALHATPLLQLGFRLGEGTGAAVALPLLRSAAEFYNNMASFESAGVTL